MTPEVTDEGRPFRLVLRCLAEPAHGYWPRRHHPEAIRFAHEDPLPRLKLARMLSETCLVCGSTTQPTLVPAWDADDDNE